MIQPYNPRTEAGLRKSSGTAPIAGWKFAGGKFMPFVPVMWAVWGITIVIMIAMFLFRSRLTRDEEDQLFLGDSMSHENANQQAILARATKIQPLIRVSEIVAAVATLFVIGYYVKDVFNQFQ
jgi:hypothetical protein